MNKRHGFAAALPALVLTCLFAGALLYVLLTGAAGYRSIADRLQTQYGARTALDYLTAKVQHYDARGQVRLGTLEGAEALLLQEELGGEAHITYLYVYEGQLCELLAGAGDEVSRADGTPVLPLEQLELTAPAENLLQIRCSTETDALSCSVALRGARLEVTP